MSERIETKVYAAKAKDPEILKNSSSGGLFTVLSDDFLEKGYPVACAVYDYEAQEMRYRLVHTKAERDAARGSKYVQSFPGDIHRQCADWLRANPEGRLLFVGLGCHAAAFRKFAEVCGVADRVTVADIICHGTPSPDVWKDFLGGIERRERGKADFVTFKDKRTGWKTPAAYARVNGKEISLKEYVKIFYSRCALRPSCHKCPYAAVGRNTDITIGDFWGVERTLPEHYDPMGNSLALIHTQEGMALFDRVKARLKVVESNTADCRQPNLERPTPVSEERSRFWADYRRRGIDYISRKYGRKSLLRRILGRIRRMIPARK